MNKRVGIYVRCSTAHQDLDLQRDDLSEFAKRRCWQIHQIYEDKGISGAKDKRPALDQLMADARRGKFDLIAVWRFDRFGRSVAHLVNSLNEFQSLGIDFVSLNEAVDTSTPAGRVLFSVMASIAEFERTLIQERVKAGVARAMANGVRFGRPRVGIDYQRAVELRGMGWSIRRIAKELKASPSTVYRLVGGE